MIKVLFTALMLSLSAAACQEQYSDLEDGIYAEFNTNKGVMVAKLHYDKTPVTVANFISLAEGTNTNVNDKYKGKKFYDGVIFHRVIKGFMIQGGDGEGTGAGNPGYKFKDEFHPSLQHDKANILSMANAGPRTNGSQFFITEKATPFLNNKHTVFGELVIGADVRDLISNVKTGAQDKPEEDVVINAIKIYRKGKTAKAFDAVKVFNDSLIEEKAAEQKRIEEEKIAKEKAIAQYETDKKDFIKKNKSKGKVKEFDSGLVMVYTKTTKNKQPLATDKVNVDYAGYFVNGKLFDTSIKEVAKANNQYNEVRDKQNGYRPIQAAYNKRSGMVPGFTEALLDMKIGEEATILFPSTLGWGTRGAGGVIPPNAAIIFDIKLKEVVK